MCYQIGYKSSNISVMQKLREKTYQLLRKSEKYFKTDMVYLVKGGSWLVFGQFISSASAFLLAIAFANLLPKETYGNYKYVLSIVSILSIPTLGGINTALTQAIARGYEGSLIPALKTKLRWGSLGGIASLILSLYYYLNNNSVLTISFLIIAIFIPFVETLGIYGSLLNGKKLFNYSTKYYFISRIISVAILITTIFFTNNLFIILLSYFLPWTTLRLFFLFISLKKFPLNNKEDSSTISYGKHLSLIGIIGNFSMYFDNILLFHYLGAVQVATYAFAFAPVDQIRALYKIIPTLGIPKLSSRSIKEIDSILYKRLSKLFIIGTIIALLYYLTAPYLFKILFPQYTDSIFFSQLLAIILLLRLPMSFLGAAVQSKLNITPKKWLYWRITPKVIFIITLLVLTPLYGIIGVILSRTIFLLSSFVTNFIQWKMLLKKFS